MEMFAEHLYKDPDWLWDMYWLKDTLATGAMAKLAGCCHWTIVHYMEHFDIPRRSKSESVMLSYTEELRANRSKTSRIAMSNMWNKEWFRARMSGKSHYNWRDGSTLEDYSDVWTHEFRERIRARDNHCCVLCGVRENGRAHSVHHIDYDKEDANPMNCVTLCTGCHGKTNTHRDFWQEKLTFLMYGITRTPIL